MTTTIKRITVVCLGCLFMVNLMAQKQFKLEDLIPGGATYTNFTPETLRQLQWFGDEYMYVKNNEVYGAIPGKAEKTIFTLEELNSALSGAGIEQLKSFPAFTLPQKTIPVIAFTIKGHRIQYNFIEKRITADYQLAAEWSHFDYSPENGYLAFTEKNNLKIVSAENQVTAITNESDEGIVCGQSVHQNEFGISKGTYWSPKGNALAFYRMDETMVTTYPLVNVSARTAELVPRKYPMAGMKSHHVTVGVYNISTGQTVWLKTGLPQEKYLTNIAWSPDEKSIYIAELNRDQNEMHLVRYSAITGEKEADLFTETSKTYVEASNPVLFLPNDPQKFIWQSDRDGFNHLYLYDISGQLIKQLTTGEWVVQRVQGFDRKGEHIFITATAPHPASSKNIGTSMETYAWQINLKSGKRTCYTLKTGVHNTTVSPSGLYAIDLYTAPQVVRETAIVRVKDGKEITQLLVSKNPFEGYNMPEISTGTVKAADGKTDLHYRLLKPVGMKADKKYPTVIYVYGGPHSQNVTGGWNYGTRGWEIYMAQLGYVVYVLDNRGTSNRGKAFEEVIHRQLGVTEMADQMEGVKFLKSLPYVDANRIGVHGWSYGGFMTTNLMVSHPDVFKVGVAGGPVIDWKFYEIMYGERYMDHPDDNPEGYKNSDLKQKAGNLKGRLLLIHGDVDPVVVWQHSLTFLKACIDANTYPDYFVYPGHQHNMMGKDRIHLHEKITRYFEDFLK
ncbi:DPP IV N-terminal domain-containing protein [Parabacteroides sp. PF5-9]|uniref:S9 family peptidase n=1 Tax=Parabacteroides sp. PF5-9 TaxID=1742404 RepID=UPI002473AE95|nr:DPP IV N-terminal domain-containing protein [Parabacteroides sp. PF5-9]MDH6358410.1 dipeptidyl-peptidase-4 [Parabacteroides sp. PF5-9]